MQLQVQVQLPVLGANTVQCRCKCRFSSGAVQVQCSLEKLEKTWKNVIYEQSPTVHNMFSCRYLELFECNNVMGYWAYIRGNYIRGELIFGGGAIFGGLIFGMR